MSPEAVRLHPEVEGILREMAARPGSSLLRAGRRPEARDFSTTRAQIGGSESWLASAERHLVEVYREEVAFALRQAAWMRLASEGVGWARVYRTVSTDHVISVPSRREVAVSAGRALEWKEVSAFEPDLQRVLENLVSPDVDVRANPDQLLVAAHRLVPQARGRILAGTAWAILRQFASARMILAEAVRLPLAPEHLAVAWSNLAGVLDNSDRPDLALRAATRSLEHLPEMIPARWGCLWYALRLGDHALAEQHARELELAFGRAPVAWAEVERHWSEMKGSAAGRLGPRGRSIVRDRLVDVGPAARRLFDALS